MTTYRMYRDSERELRFPLAVVVPTRTGDRGKHGEVVRGYVGVALLIAQRSRSNTATGSVQASKRPIAYHRGITTTRDPVVRFAIMLVAALLENLWLVLRWAVVARHGRRARPARGAHVQDVL